MDRPSFVEARERLALMVGEIANASPLYHPSVMWEHLNALNTEQVERLGLSHFKRSVNQNYFNWLPTNLGDNQMRRVLRHWMQRPTFAPFRSRMEVPQLLEGFAGQRTLETRKARISLSPVRRAALGPGDARRCAGPARQGRGA